jgi:hypothetical protein
MTRAASALDTELREAMLLWAGASTGMTAGVQLLIDTGFLPERLHAAGCTVEFDGPVRVVGVQFIKALHTDVLINQLSHAEEALLRLAASLAGKTEVNLARALERLDDTNRRHALAAFTTVLGGAR